MFDTLPSSIEFIKARKHRALGVTSAMRAEQLPDVPTIGGFLRGYDAIGWNGIGTPKNTPPEIIEKLNKEMATALADAKLKAQIAELGATVAVTSPAEFATLIAEDVEKWGNRNPDSKHQGGLKRRGRSRSVKSSCAPPISPGERTR